MFNKKSRTANVALASVAGIGNQLCKILGSFVYRTVFLMILSKEYLGINGLFTNIIQLFSLAELGIGAAILYRMYKPFAQQDTRQIAALLNFYKKVYRLIALAVCVLAICLFPFIHHIVNVEELPSDVNLSTIYFLFVLQSVSSYFFVYKQSLLTADQRGYTVTLIATLVDLFMNVARIVALLITKDYAVVLASGIFISIAVNFLFSVVISRMYREITTQKETLDKGTRKQILSDTFALMCHKVGQIVVTGTDNLVMAKFVGLASVGIYSNYLMIYTALHGLIVSISGNIIPSVGNFATTKDKDETYTLYMRCVSGGFWLASATTVCLYALFNPFIETWLDSSYLFPYTTVMVLCCQYFLQTSRLVSNIFINGCGLFMLDRARALIESAINLIVSIVFAKLFGVVGVMIGTCVSALATYYWREPYLLYTRFFHRRGWDYVWTTLLWSGLTVAFCWVFRYLLSFFPGGWGGFILQGIVCFGGVNLIYLIFMRKTDFFAYFSQKLLARFRKS